MCNVLGHLESVPVSPLAVAYGSTGTWPGSFSVSGLGNNYKKKYNLDYVDDAKGNICKLQ